MNGSKSKAEGMALLEEKGESPEKDVRKRV